jgi:hypothetical protein
VLLYKLIKLLKLGKYAVKVDFGGCQANASIELKEFIINSTIDAAATNAIEPGEKLLLLQLQTQLHLLINGT